MRVYVCVCVCVCVCYTCVCVCVCAAFKKIVRMRMRDDLRPGMPIPDMVPLAMAAPAVPQAASAREICCCYNAFNTLIMHGCDLQVLSPERKKIGRSAEKKTSK